MERVAELPLSPSRSRPIRLPAWARGDVAIVVALTAIGAALRFARPSWPTLWNDEVMTYSRVCGTHRQLLETLRDEPFGPLHYEIYWLMARVVTLTPAVMRLVPAVAGTLTVPAVYHLSRELLGRRAARLACGLAACSAFLLAYSRDAKMYAELWLAMTVHVACLLTAMRRGFGRKGAWAVAGWLAAGAAAAWLHPLGACVVPLDLAIALLHPRGGVERTLTVVLALAAIVAGPVAYFAIATRVPVELQRRGWDAAGIYWVNDRAAGHAPFALLCDSAGAFAFGFSWIEQPNGRARLSGPVMVGAACALAAACVLLAAAAVLGKPRESGDEESRPAEAAFGGWRAALLLGVWTVAPVYAVYRLSGAGSEPMWVSLGRALWVPGLWVGVALGVIGSYITARSRRGRRAMALLCVPLLIGGIGGPIARAVLGDASSPVVAPGWLNDEVPWTICWVAALACAASLVWARAGVGVRDRAIRMGRSALIAGALLATCAGIDVLVGNVPRNALWMPRYLGLIYPALLLGAAALLLRFRSTIVRRSAIASLVLVNLAMAGARLAADSEPPLDRVAADVVGSLSVDSTGTFVYTPDTSHTFGPNAMGSITNTCGLYYLLMASGRHLTPSQFRDLPTTAHFRLRLSADAATIARDAQSHAQSHRIIVWDRIDEAADSDQRLKEALPGWRLISTDAYAVRSFWNWGFHYDYRRRVFEKSEQR